MLPYLFLVKPQNINLVKLQSYYLNTVWTCGKRRYSNPITGPEGSRRLRLPDFKTIGT
jgi:hypothetical protein